VRILEGIWKLRQGDSGNMHYNSMLANHWHKAGTARQEAAWQKDNSEKTCRREAHENWPGEIHIIRQDDIL